MNRHTPMLRASSLHLVVGALLGAAALHTGAAQAQTRFLFELRLELGAGTMFGDLQRATLGYDTAHVQVTPRLGINLNDLFGLQLSVNNGIFLAEGQRETGRTLALQGGVRVQPRIGTAGRLWLDANAGLVLTGDEKRFGFDVGLGFEFAVGGSLHLGPFARFHNVFAQEPENRPGDARYLSAGLAASFGSTRVSLPGDRDGDGVLDADDLCVDVPRGDTPDPARRGCPRPDRDGDGVFDDEDTCPGVPQGASPDPARRGCPRPDADGDGVFDDEDTCPTTPQGANPDPARRGCPDGDDDNDGVLNSRDLCRTVPQGATPDPSRMGCPAPDRDRDYVIDGDDRCPDEPGMPRPGTDRHGCPGAVVVQAGSIRITHPVFFATHEDTILPRSFAVLTAVRDTLVAVPGVRRVSVDGHTDDVGEDASNLDLSNRRAASVVRWLTTNGIAAGRLEAHGFGETRPLLPVDRLRHRRLEAARATNRRVEFNILDPAPAQSGVVAAPAQGPSEPTRRHHRRRRL